MILDQCNLVILLFVYIWEIGKLFKNHGLQTTIWLGKLLITFASLINIAMINSDWITPWIYS